MVDDFIYLGLFDAKLKYEADSFCFRPPSNFH